MIKRTDGWTDKQKSLCVLQDFVPFQAAVKKAFEVKGIRNAVIIL